MGKSYDNMAIINQRRKIAEDYYNNAFSWITNIEERKKRITSEMSGIDFDQPVEIHTLPKGSLVQQKQGHVWSKGNYYSEVGVSPTKVGISGTGNVPLGLPKEFSSQEFLKIFNQRRISPIRESLTQNKIFTPQEIQEFEKQNATIAQDIAVDLALKKAILDAKNKGNPLSSEEIQKLNAELIISIGKLPKVQWGGEYTKPMRLYEVNAEVPVLKSIAKATTDKWSLSAQSKEVPTAGGAVQYFCSQKEKFSPRIMTLEEYQGRVIQKDEKPTTKPS